MTLTLKHISLTLVLAAALPCAAQAQVGQTSAPVLANPLFKDAKRSAGGTLTLTNGVNVLLGERSGYLMSAIVLASNSSPNGMTVLSSSGTAQVSGTVEGAATASAGVTQAANVIGVLSGFGDGMAQPLVQFLNRSDVQPRLPAGIKITADPFIIGAQLQGKVLRLSIAMNQADAANFGKAAHVLPAKKPGAKPVALRVYSDFQCPYCHQFETQTLPPLLAQLPADVSIEFHQFPLESIHPLARPSAEASECASQQGKFWEYKDALFSDRTWLTGNPNTVFIALADKLKLNTDKFKTCLAERGGKEAVDAGLADAAKLGINGTPTVFVNGFKAANPYDAAGLLRLMNYARAAAGAPASVVNPPLLPAPPAAAPKAP